MFLRCDTRNIGKYKILTDIVFLCDKAQKRDRAPRWRWGQSTIQPAFQCADSALLFIQHCCIFVFLFLHFGRAHLSFLVILKFVTGLATKCPAEEKSGHEKVGSIGQTTMETHIPAQVLVSVHEAGTPRSHDRMSTAFRARMVARTTRFQQASFPGRTILNPICFVNLSVRKRKGRSTSNRTCNPHLFWDALEKVVWKEAIQVAIVEGSSTLFQTHMHENTPSSSRHAPRRSIQRAPTWTYISPVLGAQKIMCVIKKKEPWLLGVVGAPVGKIHELDQRA